MVFYFPRKVLIYCVFDWFGRMVFGQRTLRMTNEEQCHSLVKHMPMTLSLVLLTLSFLVQCDAALMCSNAMLALMKIVSAIPGNVGGMMVYNLIQFCIMTSMLFINLTAPMW